MMRGPSLIAGATVFPIAEALATVGRRDRITNEVPNIDLTTLDAAHAISRKHAEVVLKDGAVSVRDVGSTNGTFVNDERLQSGQDHALRDGDSVSFAGILFKYRAEATWPEVKETPAAVTAMPSLAAFAAVSNSNGAPVVVAAPPPTHSESTGEMCSVHDHIRAVVMCSGCLQSFCAECVSLNHPAPLICRSCTGIVQRVGSGSRQDHAS